MKLVIILMSFYFHSGNSYYTSHSSFFLSLLVPIIAFFLGFLVTQINNKIKILRDIKSIQEFVFTWIDLIKGQVEKQISAYNVYSDHVKNVDGPSKSLDSFNLHIDKLKSITAVEYVRVFVTNKDGEVEQKNNNIFKLTNNIDYLESKHTEGKKASDIFLEIEHEYWKEWNEKMRYFNNGINELFNRYPLPNPEQDMFLNELEKEIDDWKKEEPIFDPESIDDFKSGFHYSISYKRLNLVKEICKSELERNNPRPFIIMPIIEDLLNIYKKRLANHSSFSKRFKETASSINKAYDELIKAKKDLSFYEFRFFMFLK